MLTPAYDLDAVRKRIPILRTMIPMNACSQAPQTDETRAAAERYLESWRRDVVCRQTSPVRRGGFPR